MKVVMLIDMDYFYVACEELRNPELKNKPTVVGAHPKEGRGRGVVLTCNYAARKYGLRSGMPISTAYKLKPDANYLPADFFYYEDKSKEAMAIIRNMCSRMEQVSIDEAYAAIDSLKDYGEAMAYGEKVKSEIKSKSGLPCSVGISYNKFMAKMSCESAKPNGIKIVSETEAKGFLNDIPVGKMYGVGSKTGERLERMGYHTIGDLSHAKIMTLIGEFGSLGLELHNHANGIDESEIIENYDVKSIGREVTFENDTNDTALITKTIEKLSDDTMGDVSKQNLSFRTVTLKVRYHDFTEHLKSKSIKPSNNSEDIKRVALELYNLHVNKNIKIRKLGVRVSKLTKYEMQKRLF